MTQGPIPSGPLILGSNGRIGSMFRALHEAGIWPGPDPAWHGRQMGWHWDMSAPPPKAPPAQGVIVLAGRISEKVGDNVTLAKAALDLARDQALGPVLLCSSAAVYGRQEGPLHEGTANPASDYGRAKLAMEQMAASHLHPSCCLRIGNVAGADAALLQAAKGPVTMDQFADGTTPRRAYIGPLTLARLMLGLLKQPDLPPVLNLAQPGLIAMGDLLDAAKVPWTTRPAPETALAELALDLTHLANCLPLNPATPQSLVHEAHLAGWCPA